MSASESSSGDSQRPFETRRGRKEMKRTKNVFVQTRPIETNPLVVPLKHLKHLIARPILLHTLHRRSDHPRIEEERVDAVIRYVDGVHDVVLVGDGDVPSTVFLVREEVETSSLSRSPRSVLVPERTGGLTAPLEGGEGSFFPRRVVLRFELELLNDESVDVAEGSLDTGREEGHDGRGMVREDPGGGAVRVAVMRGVAEVHVALVVAEDGTDRAFDGRILLQTGRVERGEVAVVEAFGADGRTGRAEDRVAPVRERSDLLRREGRRVVLVDCGRKGR
jgi:hypothetical protein